MSVIRSLQQRCLNRTGFVHENGLLAGSNYPRFAALG